MKLAELVYRALTDPRFRLAVESGSSGMIPTGVRTQEIEALAEALRNFKGATGQKLLDDLYALNPIPDWREE